MTPLVPALGGALMVIGLIGMFVGLQKTPERPPAPRRSTRLPLPQPSRRCKDTLGLCPKTHQKPKVSGLPAFRQLRCRIFYV